MTIVQPSLFPEDDLPVPQPAQGVDAVRNRLIEIRDTMRASASWPWQATTVALYRESVWPYLLGRLPDKDEAARLKAEIDAEVARLEAA
jgi:hypothetical protein